MKIIVGVDPGNKNLDVICKGLVKPIIIPNVITHYKERATLNTSSFLGTKKKEKNSIDMTVDGKRLLLGGLAINSDGEERAINKEKNNDPSIVNAIVMSTAYALAEAGIKSNSEVDVTLGTCLPIKEYLHQDKIVNFKRLISKSCNVKINQGTYEGKEYKLNFSEMGTTVFPEGAIALYNILCDAAGKLKKEFEKYVGKIFVITDIGGGSTDIAGVEIQLDEDDQITLVVVEELIDFLPKGILDEEEEIARILKLNHSYPVTKAEIDLTLRDKDGILPDGENDLDINIFAKERFESLASEIATSIENIIAKAPTMIQKRIVKNILTGGSVIMEITDPETKKKISFGQMVKDSCDHTLTISSDPLTDNVNGILKALTYSLKEEAEATEAEQIKKKKNS